jgi:hypothetical protein
MKSSLHSLDLSFTTALPISHQPPSLLSSQPDCQLGTHSDASILQLSLLINYQLALGPRSIALGQIQQKRPFPDNPLIVVCVFAAAGTCLPSRCLAMDVC